MRYINLQELEFPDGWSDKARAALDAIRGITGSKSEEINKRSAIWSELKDSLASISDDKCWYCEIKQIRSDNNVDHFRPKNRVKDVNPEHTGYWWLAFDYKNYRYACTFCNSQRKNPETGEGEGKHDYFPLLDETKRAYIEGNERDESPTLLDPCLPTDPALLDFLENGQPCPRYPDEPVKFDRANTSIKRYHLDHPKLNEERRKTAIEIKELIDQAEYLYRKEELDSSFYLIVKKIANKLSKKAELSMFCKKILKGLNDDDHPCIELILNSM